MTGLHSIPDGITTRSWAAMTSVGFGLAFLSFIPGMLVVALPATGPHEYGLPPNAGCVGS